jgi:hypothetical protein
MWNSADFRSWTAATGLPADQAAVILGISERTIKRLRNDEDISIKDSIALAAQSYIEASRTTKGSDAEQVDSWASQAGLADLCAALPYAHVTGHTAAIARGWTSANSAKLRQVAQPNRMPKPTTFNEFRLEWYETTDLPWGVECRVDADGRPYRIASIERTLLELGEHVGFAAQMDDCMEAYRGAFAAETPPDMAVLAVKARKRGEQAFEQINMIFDNIRPRRQIQ